MKKIIALVLALAMVFCLAACGGTTAEGDKPATSSGNGSTPAATTGGETAGPAVDPYSGIAYATDTEYTYLYSAELTSWNYLKTSVTANQKSLANFVDTLVEYDNLGNLVGCLAESWEESEDGLTWTFHLRDDAKWYTFEGEEYAPVTAHDFVFAARLICNVDFDSDIPDMLTSYVVNGSELYNKVIDDFTQLGVEATDDYTLVYHLKHACPYFATLLTYGCYFPANQAYYESMELDTPEIEIDDDGNEVVTSNVFGTDYDKLLYNGAYICTTWMPNEGMTWVKNDNYWDAANVFITKVTAKYNAQAESIAPEMYLRGELDECTVTTNILDDWLSGENGQFVHPTMTHGGIMYMPFDFNPHFEDEAAGENYKIAVNNKNFRLSIATGINKEYTLSAYDPNGVSEIICNLMVPANFASVDGKDYTQFGNLQKYANGMYDPEAAVKYRDAAIEELKAAGCTFPVAIPCYYNPSEANMDSAYLLLEKQLEELLGNDYIDITVYAGPATNFIGEIRRPGLWGLFEAGWSPDYADPATYFEPFGYGWTFGSLEYIEGDEYKTGYIYTQEDYDNAVIDDESLIGTPQYVFNSLVEAARAETDLAKRYEAFAKAEEFVLSEAMVIPYRFFNDGYVASNIALFEKESSMAGVCSYKLKGVHLLEKSYSMEEYETAKAAWDAAKLAQ